MKISSEAQIKYFLLYKETGDINALSTVFAYMRETLSYLLATRYSYIYKIVEFEDISSEFYLHMHQCIHRYNPDFVNPEDSTKTPGLIKWLRGVLENFLKGYWAANKKLLNEVKLGDIHKDMTYDYAMSEEFYILSNSTYDGTPKIELSYYEIRSNKKYMENLVKKCNGGQLTNTKWHKKEVKKINRSKKGVVPDMKKVYNMIKLDYYWGKYAFGMGR